MSTNSKWRRMVRGWVAPAVVGGIAVLLMIVLWSADEVDDEQGRIMTTMLIVILTTLILVAWFGFFAEVTRRVRTIGLGSFGGSLVLFFLLFRMDGVSGDLVPNFVFRFGGSAPVPKIAEKDVVEDGVSFPQFFGPNRNGIITGTKLNPDWKSSEPVILWRIPVGEGWSGFAVAGGKAVTQEQHGEEEQVVCYELATGKKAWAHTDKTRHETPLGGIGPRATPTIVGGRVYTLGATGILNCLELSSGNLVWSKNTGASVPEWGFAGSPLVVDGMVVVPAASLAAYDAATGNRLWSSGRDPLSYASPILHEGRIVMLYQNSCAAHDLKTGGVHWKYPWRGNNPKAAQPVPFGSNRLVISSGYGVGADAFRVTDKIEPLWKSKRLRAKFANFVHRDGHFFALSDGILVCVNAEDGERVWKGGRFGHGQLLLVGDLLLITSERGDVALVDADASEFRERARIHVLDDKTWNSPALAGRYLLVRNSKEAVCLELPIR